MSGFDWSVLQEIGQATSDNINSYVADNYEDIQPLVNILHIKKPQKSDLSQRYKGKTFCITGKLVEFDNRNALVYDIEAKGGTVVSSVTSKTQYLITMIRLLAALKIKLLRSMEQRLFLNLNI